jgi:hypothetical protein
MFRGILLCFGVAVAILGSETLNAQDVPKAELFGGYSLLRLDTDALGLTSYSTFNGWAAAIDLNLKPWLGAVGDFSGHYGTGNDLTVRSYRYLFGPQIAIRKQRVTVFLHGLAGETRNNIGGAIDSGLGIAGGGGLDYNFRRRVSIRVVQGDFVRSSTFGTVQHDGRLSAGLVLKFGGTSAP